MITAISYIAGGGGNHLKNIFCLDSSFANSNELRLPLYYNKREIPPGTVHSVPGRNITQDKLDAMVQHPDQSWLLHGHWGELMTYRSTIRNKTNRWLLLTLDSQQDRTLIKTRHRRLHQHTHPYWVDEEQFYLYQPEMYQLYFDAQLENIFQLSLTDFWNPDLSKNNVVERINSFFKINIDPVKAQDLHQNWWEMNFSFKFDPTVAEFYKNN